MFLIVARLSRRARTMPREIAADERDAGALDRDVGAGAHRDADVASASAGASLMPSPAIATTRPSRCSRWTTSRFPSGRTSAITSSIPSSRDRLRGRAVVARQHHDAQALARAAPNRFRRRRLDRIRDADAPASCRRPRRTSPSARPPAAPRPAPSSATASMPRSAQQLALPTRTGAALDGAATPAPGQDSKSETAGSFRPRARAPPTIAAASGCSLACSSAGGEPQQVVFGERRDGA